MKIIDQTPLLNEEGEIGISQRIQGTLRFGFKWYPELKAQESVLAHLSRALGKGYTAIRNRTLGKSGIVIPISLVGPAGIYAIHVTHLRGTYQARRDEWGQMFGINYKPDPVNIITRTQLLARALRAYIERQGIELPQPVEPIILAADPGLHLESMQPATRIVLADAVERWAASLNSQAPIFTVETAHELADRIVNPRPPKKKEHPAPEPREDAEISRADSIFAASEDAGDFDPNDLGFAFEEGDDVEVPPGLGEPDANAPTLAQGDGKRRILRMTISQWVLLGGLILVEVCVLLGFGLVIFLNT
jgi:hypothetical protein